MLNKRDMAQHQVTVSTVNVQRNFAQSLAENILRYSLVARWEFWKYSFVVPVKILKICRRSSERGPRSSSFPITRSYEIGIGYPKRFYIYASPAIKIRSSAKNAVSNDRGLTGGRVCARVSPTAHDYPRVYDEHTSGHPFHSENARNDPSASRRRCLRAWTEVAIDVHRKRAVALHSALYRGMGSLRKRYPRARRNAQNGDHEERKSRIGETATRTTGPRGKEELQDRRQGKLKGSRCVENSRGWRRNRR